MGENNTYNLIYNTIQQKGNSQPSQKLGRGANQVFSKEDIQTANRHLIKKFIPYNQGIVNQNQNEIPSHSCENGPYQKYKKTVSVNKEMEEK